MKKLLVAALCLYTALSLAACTAAEDEEKGAIVMPIVTYEPVHGRCERGDGCQRGVRLYRAVHGVKPGI